MALFMWGFLAPADRQVVAMDPDLAGLVEMGIAVTTSAAIEGWYWLAKRYGWST
jgi:hypothetical protein